MDKPLVIVLAAGEGKRFAPLVVNKTMLPFLGKPFLQHIFELLAAADLHNVLVITNKDNDEWVKSYTHSQLHIDTLLFPEPIGMGPAVLAAQEKIGDQPVMIINGVDIVDPQLLKTIVEKAMNSYAVVAGIEMKEYFPGGYIQIDGDRATSIIEKPGAGNEPSNLVKLVFDYFSQPQEFLAKMKEFPNDNDDQYELALNALMKDHDVKFVGYHGYWQKLKHSHYILDMMELYFENKLAYYISPSAQISDKAVIEGAVYIDDSAKIEAGAVIKGPAYIGRNAIVGTHTLIRHSIIEENTVVGFGTEVARSYVGPRCALHHNFIGDSILESDINPSYGTCTANWKLLEARGVHVKLHDKKVETTREKLGAIIAKGVFFGVNCTILPGVAIGAHARIYPGSIVHQGIKAGSVLKSYQKQDLIEANEM
jgi:bifunctional UDP-N-acetylglucosamine pyrophosphorylase/glucosamine-1-phosphate N-acetyltransferase